VDTKIVITQMSAISSLGSGFEGFASSLLAPPAIGAVKDFDFHSLPASQPCFPVTGFDPETILGKKGLRTKDRATKLLLSALEMGYKPLFESAAADDKPGLCIGTTFGSVSSIGDFLSDAIVNGPHNVNPQAFANTVINSPTSNANIRYASTTLSSTVSTTFNAGLDALLYAIMFLRQAYCRCIISGGLEEISYYACTGLSKSGILSQEPSLLPFGKDSRGTLPGEGVAVFCLETEESAKVRGAAIIAEIAGIASCFDPQKGPFGYNPKASGARHAVTEACSDAGIQLSDIGFVAASANGVPAADDMESTLLADLLPRTPVAAYKVKTGECLGASPCLSLACALSDLKSSRVSGTGGAYPLRSTVNLVQDEHLKLATEYALVNAFSCDGFCGSIVLKNRN